MNIDDLIFSKREFLKELQALCKDWNVTISGCGCCGSPWIVFDDDTMDCLYVDSEKLEITTRIYDGSAGYTRVERIVYKGE